MSDHSDIEWTDATWNPVRGCVKVSPGCKHCYSETFAERWRGIPGHPYEQGFDVRLVPERLDAPLRWAAPRKVFVNSMSDLFQDAVPETFVRAVFETMRLGDWHTYQVLSKRAARMRQAIQNLGWQLTSARHIWVGVSVEDRKYGLPRIDELRATPVAVRFLSVEPLLEDLGAMDLSGIDWVIVGGESGPRARPMNQDWVLAILDQCQAAGVPFFFKQWGGTQKKRAGRILNGRTYDDFPLLEARTPPGAAERRRRLAIVA